MNKQIKIAIVEKSEVISRGIVAILSHMRNLDIQIIADAKEFRQIVKRQNFHILIVNPLTAFASIQQMRSEVMDANTSFIALRTVLGDKSLFLGYDDMISLFDSAEQIERKITRIISTPKNDIPSSELSERENEIVGQVVKGLSNKQIADALNISVHTVVAHRRNISRKLNINSISGLTIYAIVNKLIEIDNLEDKLGEVE